MDKPGNFLLSQIEKHKTPGLQYYYFTRDSVMYSFHGGLADVLAGIPNPMPLKWTHPIDQHRDFNYQEYFNEIFEKHSKPRGKPNKKFAYSNLGYILLGMIIEMVSGQSYEDYVNGNIIGVAGIDSEKLGFTIQDENLHAKGYQKRLSLMNVILGIMLDRPKYFGKGEGKWIPALNHYVNGTPYGGLVGSGMGFVAYIQELLKPE